MVEYFLIEIYILMIMAIVMFATSILIFYLGHKKGTPNTILWVLFTFTRGIHWLVESISDYYEQVLEIEIYIFSRIELFTAFSSSFILLAACLEYNGMIRRHLGKLIVLILSVFPLYWILTVDEDTKEEFEMNYIVKGDIVTSEIFRFSYGFFIPLVSIVALIFTYFYYFYETRKGKIFYNPKLLKTTLILIIIILIFSIFEGFDYYEEQGLELVFISLRAISLTFFIIIPLIVVFTYDLGLQKFLIIEHSGVPLLVYSFETKSDISDEHSLLTSGFVAAIIGFSTELTQKESGFLSVQSNYLYYIITKTETKIYALQSILKNKYLENQFFEVAKEIDKSLASVSKPTELNITQAKEIIDHNFSPFY